VTEAAVQAAPTQAAWPAVQAAAEAGSNGATPPWGPVPAGRSDQELDALALDLYDRLRSRLRMELLVDRERAGLVTDLR
jgi:hypothetical protein